MPTSFSRCVGFFWSLRVWRLWASVRVVSYLWGKGGLRCCNKTTCRGLDEEGAKKGHPKSRKTRKTRRKHETQENIAIVSSTFGHLFGLGGPGHGCQMRQDASVPATINNHLLRKKRNDKVITLENLSLFVTRQQMQVTIPNWVAVRE